jgi:hypothetical protein
MSKKKAITDADRYALTKMPEGWFKPGDLPYLVRSPHFRCQRLEQLGQLERRIMGEIPDLWSEYRKIEPV